MSSYLNKKSVLCGKIICLTIAWYWIGYPEKDDIRKRFYKRGYNFSQRFKNYKLWDKYAEPLFISQFTTFFTAGHAFIEGMISDNEDQESVELEMKKMKQNIINDLARDKV